VFAPEVSISNPSRHTLWNESAVSDAAIFVTADYLWGLDEVHYDDHRYMISTYVRRFSSLLAGSYYDLEDRYMTVRRYA